MRVVPTNYAVGHKLAETIYDEEGRILLRQGTLLTGSMVQSLQSRGYRTVSVINPLAPDLVVDEAINQQTRIAAYQSMKRAVDLVSEGKKPSAHAIGDTVNMLIENVNSEVLYGLSTIRLIDEYTFTHSVHVCILSLLLGKKLFLSPDQLFELGMGTILHDIGKIKIPKQILHKPCALTPEEFSIMATHAELGYNMLVDLGLSYSAAHVAYQHHERMDGSGYPRGLVQDEIILFARIAALADVFDAMTSDRVYRKGMRPSEAVTTIEHDASRLFDPIVTRAFLGMVALYPVGTIVELSNGAIAVVAEQNKALNAVLQAEYSKKPIVRIVSENQVETCTPYELNLLNEPSLTIVGSLPDYPPTLRIDG